MGTRLALYKHASPTYHTRFRRRSAEPRGRTYGSQKLETLGPSPLGDVDVAVPIQICFSFTGVTMQNMVILIQTTIEIWRSARKF